MKTIVLFGLVLGAISAAGKVFFGEVGGKVKLECGVNSFSNMVDWRHDGLVLRIFKKNFPSKGQSKFRQRVKVIEEINMEISGIIESDFGKFTCAADGSSHEHDLIVVSVSVPSGPLKVGADATLECKTNSGVSGQFNPKVKWQKPDGSVQIETRVELKPVASSDKGIWSCVVSCKGETFVKNVTINVEENVPKTAIPTLVENPKSSNSGNGKNSTGGVRGSGDPLLLLGLAWWIWAAIGAGGLIVIILIIVIIVVHKRNKRRKNKFLRMKKAQTPKKYCQCVRQAAAAKPQQGRRREKPSALPLQPLLQE
ncbi:CD4-2 molecule, tandem duplicate 2 [Poeciliopsis prolifica]|uniref:CD4-2 molecule, tandem duplicate 2 n=1 Tax=Poeciliopsis prolifica TaxID=188132 RepID=UPI002412F98D|nr:CD4-2 molecule, tandem duplicate 2 [Poeciliopsis prolifica]